MRAGQSAADAIGRALETARAAEELGFVRYLIAEHHNTPQLASAASAIVIQHLLAGTKSIQVGAGGVMLPNHSPLQVAETYATLDALYPGRVDLGIGRAPGTDPLTASLIVRKNYLSNQEFYDDIMSVIGYFSDHPAGPVAAYPGAGAKVHPLILGSTTHSAYVAAAAGLPYAFATHFAPDDVDEAVALYREKFRPSDYLSRPYLIISLWNFAASTSAEADREYDSMLAHMAAMLRGREAPDPDAPPVLSSGEKILLSARFGAMLKGSPDELPAQWETWRRRVEPDELMLATFSVDPARYGESLRMAKTALSQDSGTQNAQ